MNVSCGICTDNVRGEGIECVQCSFVSCVTCIRRVLEESINDPACCKCKHAWTDDFVASRIGKTWFLGAYRASRTRVLLDRQRALLPSTMHSVENEVLRRKKHALRAQLAVRRDALKQQLARDHPHPSPSKKARMSDLDEELTQVHREIRTLDVSPLRPHVPRARRGAAAAQPNGATTVRCATPHCRGFIHASEPTCAVCDATTCVECTSLKTASHVCAPDAVATAREIRRCTTACPGCKVRIQRSEGCRQMFCVVCKVFFDYITGERLHGHAHNPHYTEMLTRLRAQGELHHADMPEPVIPGCREVVTQANVMRWNIDLEIEVREKISLLIEFINHVEYEEIRKLRPRPDPLHRHRVRFILGDITEARLCATITRVEFDRKVNEHFTAMFRAFVESSRAVIQRMHEIATGLHELNQVARIHALIPEIYRIMGIANDASARVGYLHNRVHFVITPPSETDCADVTYIKPKPMSE